MDPKSLPKILYIEDTPDSRLLVRRVLGRDYVVLEAGNALDGIELAVDTTPDLILMDINLPDLSGREAATRLRTLLPNVPIVALTADVTKGARERALAAGCVGFLSKPVDIDALPNQVAEYIAGKRDLLAEPEIHQKAYQAEVVAHLESKVRELTKVADHNSFLNQQNQRVISAMKRHQRLLEAAARVGHSITSILDLDELLNATVDIICDEFDFYYAGVFLLDDENQWVVLRAGHGEAGKAMLASKHKLKGTGKSMVASAIAEQKARVVLDVDEETIHFHNPRLPRTRSEMALPLIAKEEVLGALTIQSENAQAFSKDDIVALQALADQVAIAIQNAQLMQDLEKANQEVLRSKTYEAIASTTGEAIHWVGNKAAPIASSARRVQEDFLNFLAVVHALEEMPPFERETHPFGEIIRQIWRVADSQALGLASKAEDLSNLPADRLSLFVDLESILEDLNIIQQSASTILDIKEDLIGPMRQQNTTTIELPQLLQGTIVEMGLPAGVVQTAFDPSLPSITGDPRQIDRVFTNLIKNAWEAMEGQSNPKIKIKTTHSEEPGFARIEVQDNGPGIPSHLLEKIWVSFFTTKGDTGGTGLGLSACMSIVQQSGGKIWAESLPGEGVNFIVLLPFTKGR